MDAEDIKILIRTIIKQNKEINQLNNISYDNNDESIASMILNNTGGW